MSSIKYRITERLIPLTGLKRMFGKDGEAFSKMVMENGQKQSVKMPRSINKKNLIYNWVQ